MSQVYDDDDGNSDDDDDENDDDTVDDTWVICTKDALSAATQTPTVSTSPPTSKGAKLELQYFKKKSKNGK